jgi:hypothetical protein
VVVVGGLLLGTLIIYRRSDKGHSEEE